MNFEFKNLKILFLVAFLNALFRFYYVFGGTILGVLFNAFYFVLIIT